MFPSCSLKVATTGASRLSSIPVRPPERPGGSLTKLRWRKQRRNLGVGHVLAAMCLLTCSRLPRPNRWKSMLRSGSSPAPGGGFFLSPGAVLDQAKGENIHTDLRNARECGPYETHNDSMGESLQRIDAKTRPFAFSVLGEIKRRRTIFAANGANVRETSKSLCEFAAAFGVFRV